MTGEKRAIPTCEQVLERLGEWCEGGLAAQAEEPYEEHLELCPPCASFARTYRALPRVAASALEAEMPQDAKERLRRVLAARLCGKR